jgi:hypothetical protein
VQSDVTATVASLAVFLCAIGRVQRQRMAVAARVGMVVVGRVEREALGTQPEATRGLGTSIHAHTLRMQS